MKHKTGTIQCDWYGEDHLDDCDAWCTGYDIDVAPLVFAVQVPRTDSRVG